MTVMPDREWTADDLDDLPDDGLRHELVDGVLLVRAAPVARHQLALSQLLVLLATAATPHLCVLPRRSTSAPPRTGSCSRTSPRAPGPSTSC